MPPRGGPQASADRANRPRARLLPARPNVVLLGLPKAATTWLHDCLTSEHFEPRPCCSKIKEPNLFAVSPNHSSWWKVKEGWPTQEYADANGTAVLDFSPNCTPPTQQAPAMESRLSARVGAAQTSLSGRAPWIVC